MSTIVCEAPEKFSCSEGPDCASNFPDPSTRNGKGSGNTSHWVYKDLQ